MPIMIPKFQYYNIDLSLFETLKEDKKLLEEAEWAAEETLALMVFSSYAERLLAKDLFIKGYLLKGGGERVK